MMRMSKLIEGYQSYLDKACDPNLEACRKNKGNFYLFDSIEAWNKESNGANYEIPAKELIRREYSKNIFIASP